MPSIPGYCARCDLVFAGTGGIHLENSRNITIRNSSMTCPKCGRPAKLAEGTFNATHDTLELVSGPPLTVEILEKLRDIAERARKQEITPTAAVQEAKELDVALGTLLERFLSLGLTALAAFSALIGVYLQHRSLELQKEGLALQSQSLEIQRQDSQASEDFYRDALRILAEQATQLEKLARPPHDEQGVDDERTARPKANATEKSTAPKGKSKRRAQVRKQRRIDLKERRRMFPRRAHGRHS